jgi:hypothetical protein
MWDAENLGHVTRSACWPIPHRVRRAAEDAPGRVLDHGQDVGLGVVEQVDAEEVARQDRLGLAAQKPRRGRPGPPSAARPRPERFQNGMSIVTRAALG